MKKSLSLIAIAVVLTACSSTGNKAPVSEQKLSTSFVAEKIKIETKCDWFGMGNQIADGVAFMIAVIFVFTAG